MSGSDDGFGTTSTLTVELDERSLTNVKHQIESEIGSTPIGATDGGTMSAQMAGGAGGGRERRRRRREFRWARERTGYLEDAVVYLEDIEDKVGADGGSGLGGEIIGAVVETGGDAAIETVDTAVESVKDVLIETAGSAIGTAVANAIKNENVSLEDTTLEVEEPEWHPINVEDPGNVGVEELPGPIGIEAPPESIAIEEPGGAYPLEAPSGKYPIEKPAEAYPLEDPQKPYPVESVDPIQVEVSVSGDSNGGDAVGQTRNNLIRKVPWIGDDLADADRKGTNSIREFGRDIPLLPEPAGNITDPSNKTPAAQSNKKSPRGEQGQQIEVTVETGDQSVTVEPASDQIVEDVVSALENQFEKDLRSLRSDLSDVERQLDNIARRSRTP